MTARITYTLFIFLCLALTACQPPADAREVIARQYSLVETLPHPDRPFTQGLEVDGEEMLESSGLYGHSYLMRYSLTKGDSGPGDVIWKTPLAEHFFAEGLTALGDNIYLLSWKRGVVHIVDKHSGELRDTRTYTGEGWGLTHNGQALIRSDGSSQLHFHHPDTFAPIRQLQVTEKGEPLNRINELEYVQGVIWANIWQENRLIGIDATSGEVVYTVDLKELVEREGHKNPDWVLNGIAWDANRQGLWVTGKRWRNLYLLQLSPAEDTPATAGQ